MIDVGMSTCSYNARTFTVALSEENPTLCVSLVHSIFMKERLEQSQSVSPTWLCGYRLERLCRRCSFRKETKIILGLRLKNCTSNFVWRAQLSETVSYLTKLLVTILLYAPPLYPIKQFWDYIFALVDVATKNQSVRPSCGDLPLG